MPAEPKVRLRNGSVLIHPLGEVLRFIDKDGSYRAYDVAPVMHDDSLTVDDIRIANRLMARMSDAVVNAIFERRNVINAALRPVGATASLVVAQSAIPWQALHRLYWSLDGVPEVGLARITKVLHKKRPALVPILDSVVEQYLVNLDGPVTGPLAERAIELTRRYKRDLDANIEALMSVRSALRERNIDLSECRLLDIFVWALSGTYLPPYQRASADAMPAPIARQDSPPSRLPTVSDVEVFQHDDEGFRGWVVMNPAGFILNCEAKPRRTYLKLHRVGCFTMAGSPSAGNKWTSAYMKVCSNSEPALAEWAKAAAGGSLSPCGFCFKRW